MVPVVARRLLYREPLSVAARNRLYRSVSIRDRFVSSAFLAIIALDNTLYTYICLSKAANYDSTLYFLRTK
jgi:hypothetical protein